MMDITDEALSTRVSSSEGPSSLYQESLLEADRQMNQYVAFEDGHKRGGLVDAPVTKHTPRLQSLDVSRGITIALMIFVDNVGDSWPHVDHTPWNGIRLADFVMPSFDVIVGMAIAFSMKQGRLKSDKKWGMFVAALKRSIKLFLLGIWTQAGTDFPTIALKHFRIMGILQRVSLCYATAAFAEIYIPEREAPPASQTNQGIFSQYWRRHWRLVAQRGWHWAFMVALVGVWCALTYGVDPGCGRGHTHPDCNVASWLDQKILGVNHMYFPHNGGVCEEKDVTFQRTHECSSCHPGKCLKPGAPEWCGYESACGGAPFDPEGLLSSVTCVVASLFGAHVGRAVFAFEDNHFDRILHWVGLSLASIGLGFALALSGTCPLNTDLYSPSFLLVTNGASVLGFTACYVACDVKGRNIDESFAAAPLRGLLECFRVMGMNSIAVYLLSCTGVAQAVLGAVFWDKREENLANLLWPTGVYWGPSDDNWLSNYSIAEVTHQQNWVMVWCVCAYIPFWSLVAFVMHKNGLYLKV